MDWNIYLMDLQEFLEGKSKIFPTVFSKFLRFRLHLCLSLNGQMAIWCQKQSLNYNLSDLDKVGEMAKSNSENSIQTQTEAQTEAEP